MKCWVLSLGLLERSVSIIQKKKGIIRVLLRFKEFGLVIFYLYSYSQNVRCKTCILINYRLKFSAGSNLVQRAIRAMASDDADEVVLETEITNKPALKLYENLGFVRDKRLFR